MEINDVFINIQKSWYNKTRVAEDGITHHVDTSTQYPLYQLNLSKTYFDIEDKVEVINKVIEDLHCVIEHLQQMKEIKQQDVDKGEEIE